MFTVNKLFIIKMHLVYRKPLIKSELNAEQPVDIQHLFKMFQDAAAFSAKRT